HMPMAAGTAASWCRNGSPTGGPYLAWERSGLRRASVPLLLRPERCDNRPEPDEGHGTMNEQPAAGTEKGRSVAPRRRSPWALLAAFVLLGLGGAVLLARPRSDPMRLLLLATAEYEQGRVDRAEALLNERQARLAPTALDWILRARIAQTRGRPDEAI